MGGEMIKIKDDFDLDKLIGFKDNYCRYTYKPKDKNSRDLELSIVKGSRLVEISCYFEHGEDDYSIPSMLYNLFKMGIIEEVRSE